MHLPTRALAALLCYPEEGLRAALPEVRAALLADPATAGAAPLAGHLATGDLLDRQEEYVALFDRTRGLALHLFEHVHGDSRERGPAMIALREQYMEAGLFPAENELPDWLPMMLEYASVVPERGRQLLKDAAPILDLIHGRLASRGSPYALALRAALALAGVQPSSEVPEAPEPTPEELDAAYEEAPVTFGPNADPAAEACGSAPALDRLRAARRPAPGVTPLTNPTPNRPAIRRAVAAE